MVDYIEDIKKIEIRFRTYKNKGVRAVLLHLDKDGGVLKESEYAENHYSKNVADAYKQVLKKMKTVLTGEF